MSSTDQYTAPWPKQPPKKKHTVRNILLGIVLLLVLIGIATAVGGGDGSTSVADATPSTEAPAAQEPAAAAPTQDDPLSDGGWTASDVQVEQSQYGTGVTARVTNMEDQTRTGLFTLTVFSGGQRIYMASGSASDVEPEQAATVTFIGTTEQLPGDPAGYTYEFQSDLP